jgi:DNA-binding CsgD family transcriptional regulator
MMDERRVRLAAARIRQLACLDATGPQLAPLLLRELREVVAFDTGGYFHPGASGAIESFMEAPEMRAVMPLYYDEHMQSQERRLTGTYAQAAQEHFGPQMKAQLVKVPMWEFESSDFYNALVRPAGLLDCVSLMPRQGRSQPVGALKLYRCTNLLAFHASELGELARLERFLAMALEPRAAAVLDDDQEQGTEMLIVTAQGRVLWMSARSETWMTMALGERWRGGLELPHALALVLQRMHWIRAGEPVDGTPQFEVRNAHGRFTLRGCVLSSQAADGEAVGIQITRHLNGSLRLLEALRALPLRPRQAEIAYWLARGLSESRIAQQLKLSLHTVVYHRRQIYARLGTASRQEFLDRLVG